MYVVLPCKHIMCDLCAARVAKQVVVCPFCRKVAHLHEVYAITCTPWKSCSWIDVQDVFPYFVLVLVMWMDVYL